MEIANSHFHPQCSLALGWFAAKTNSKPGFEHLKAECWTIVSTPIYAAKQIKLIPMQDVKTGEFIPQEPGYLKNVPAKQLVSSFLKAMNICLFLHHR